VRASSNHVTDQNDQKFVRDFARLFAKFLHLIFQAIPLVKSDDNHDTTLSEVWGALEKEDNE
jgi:hypothetical protein